MAFWVMNKKGKKISVEKYNESDRGTLFCPSCGCAMNFVSSSSNGKAAHFAGSHKPGCDIGFTHNSGTIDKYELSKKTIEDLLNAICDEGVRKAGTTNPKHNKTATPKVDVKESKDVKKLTVRTVRQLFNVLAGADPDAIIDENGTTVKDVYCGISTRSFYTNCINGIHLVFAEYTGTDKYHDLLKFFFAFPAERNKNFYFMAQCTSDDVYEDILNRLEKGRRVLVFANFSQKHCDINSPAQIVQIRK